MRTLRTGDVTMSDVPNEDIHPPARRRVEDVHDCDAESCHGMSDTNGPCGACCSCLGGCVYWGPDPEPTRDRREVLAAMTRDAEPYAEQVDTFGPPRTESPSPAEAHAIMQRVTGQPDYGMPGGLMNQAVRDGLANASLSARGLDFWVTKGDAEKFLPGATLDLDAHIAEMAYQHAKAENDTLTRMVEASGVPADQVTIFELDRPIPPVAVRLVLPSELASRWSELTADIGNAMLECSKAIAAAVQALQAATDPTTGEMRAEGEDRP
jgi:hypothetical protein